jgi:error-prone DNA polymerase
MSGTPPFTHLSVRSCFSMRDGAIRPAELAEAVAASGMSHVAVTDRDGLYGAVRVARACAGVGVRPVFGADLPLAPDAERPGWGLGQAGRDRFAPTQARRVRAQAGSGHRGGPDPRSRRPGRGPGWLEDDAPRVTLLARSQAGYGDLCRAVTAAHAARRGDPHLAADDLGIAAAADGVVALLGPDSPVGRLLAAERPDAAEAELRRWMNVLGREQVRLAVRNHRVAPSSRPGPGGVPEPGDDARIRRTLALADRLGVPAVAVNDVRYLRPQDAAVADVLACVRQQVPLGARHVGRSTAEAWLTTPAEQLERFVERPDLLVAAHDLASSCEVDLGLGGLHVPRLLGLAEPAAAGELHHRCWEGLSRRFTRVTPVLRERLERELDMVDRLQLHELFLAVALVVEDVRAAGILVACRGSAAGSLVCYALGISDVDPVAHDLAFERFMNPYRDELPDIDLDVESARREDVYDLVLQRFGADRTACVAMVETFQARSAIREVGKTLGMPAAELDLIAKAFVHTRARDVRKAVERLPELKGVHFDAGQLDTLFELVERIDGFPRHLALHPCGILLGDTRLTDLTPLERSAHDRAGPDDPGARGFPMSPFDKDDVAALGLLKLDVLGVRMLSAMRHCLDLVNGTHTAGDEDAVAAGPLPPTRPADPGLPGRDRAGRLAVDAIPAGDPATYELIRSAESVGIFQIESPGQRELLGRLQPEQLGDLITEISLFRPGPVKADMVTPYVARRHGQEETVYAHPTLEPVLAQTHGVIVYHEQVMGVLSALTGCDLAYADLLRRQLGDETKAPAIRGWLLARARDRGMSVQDAERVWEQLASFASFGFCKAHAAAFAVPTYRSAFLKAHVLPELLAGLLTHDPGMYPRRLLLDEGRRFGVAVLPCDVDRSERAYTVEVVDRGLAEHLLGLRDALHAAARARQAGGPVDAGTAPGLPPGWRWSDADGDGPAASCPPVPVPPGGVDAGDAGDGYRYAVRIGLQAVSGITEEEIAALRRGRPYTSLSDLRERGGLSRPTVEALTDAGALDRLAGVGRRGGPRDRRALRLGVEELWRGRARRRGPGPRAEQAMLDLHADHEPQLPADSEATRVRAELAATGLDVSRHVASFYEPLLEALGVVRACDLERCENQARVRVAGVKVAVQSPAQRSGQRVMFLSLDDRTGQTQTTYFERSLEDCAWTVLHAWLLVAEGRVSRRGQRGATVVGHRAWDLSRLWRAWQEGWLAEALAERGTPAPHERMASKPAGLQASEFGRGSR